MDSVERMHMQMHMTTSADFWQYERRTHLPNALNEIRNSHSNCELYFMFIENVSHNWGRRDIDSSDGLND